MGKGDLPDTKPDIKEELGASVEIKQEPADVKIEGGVKQEPMDSSTPATEVKTEVKQEGSGKQTPMESSSAEVKQESVKIESESSEVKQEDTSSNSGKYIYLKYYQSCC